MTRQDLIALVRRIRAIDAGESDEDRDHLMDVFTDNVPHPSAYHLLLTPELVTFDDRRVTDEEVVDIALSYEPIALGPGNADVQDH
ncbi:MAG: hypothetical protein WKF41_09400 [Gaiellaceae bacterium]